MKKLTVLALAAGLALTACAKHDDSANGSSAATSNEDVGADESSGNDIDLNATGSLPADEGNLSNAAGNLTDTGDANASATDTAGNAL